MVTLLTHTPDPDKVVATAARLCYSSDSIEELGDKLTEQKINSLVGKLIEMGHESPLEHVTFTFGIEGVSRALSHQLVRHRIASFCVSGDTIVRSYGKQKKWTVKQLYDWQFDSKKKGRLKLIEIRSVDETKRIFIKNKLKNIFQSGFSQLYRITTKTGRSIRTTLNHRFLTEEGYKELGELSIGERIFANGMPALENEEYLRKRYLQDNIQRKDLAKEIGCCETILHRSFAKFGIVKPHSDYPNRKGGGQKGFKLSEEHRAAISKRMSGENSPHWKHDGLGATGGRVRANKWYSPDKCWGCGLTERLERHHINKIPQDNSKENILFLCQKCHKAFHKKHANTVFLDEIVSIEKDTIEMVYDIELKHNPHNFVANGLVIHNSQKSQRYVKEGEFPFTIPPSIADRERALGIFRDTMSFIQLSYDMLIEMGIKAEDARYVLPNACQTSLILTMNARSLYNFFSHRLCIRSQWEIRKLAEEMLDILKTVSPLLFSNVDKPCIALGYCPEKGMSCGYIEAIQRNKGKEGSE